MDEKSWRRWGRRRRTIFLRRLKKFKDLPALENRTSPVLTKCWPLRKRQNGSMQRRRPAYVQNPRRHCGSRRGAGRSRDTFSIYQLKSGNETLDYRFEPLDAIQPPFCKAGEYTGLHRPADRAGRFGIYTRFNIPARLQGVPWIFLLHQDGRTPRRYTMAPRCRILQPDGDQDQIQTPRAAFV